MGPGAHGGLGQEDLHQPAQEYRNATKKLWADYGLFSLKGHAAQLGGGKKDIAMLFTYACMDNYLKDKCRLGFVLTQTLFKSKGAGDGFRRFGLGKKEPIRVVAVDDLSDFQPSDAATNRTSVAVFQKGVPTRPQVKYIIWRKKPKARISLELSLDDVDEATTRKEYMASPVDPDKPTSPWITLTGRTIGAVQKAKGGSVYKASEGSNTLGANGVYWLRLVEKRPDGLWVVENLAAIGDTTVKPVCEPLEEEFIYPLLRGRDVSSWLARPQHYVLLVQDPAERRGYDEEWLQTNFEYTYNYLEKFEAVLTGRAGFRKYFCKPVTDPKTGEKRLIPEASFYSMYNVAESILSAFKVVWREQASFLTAAVVASDERLGKTVIPDHKLMYVPVATQEEADYLCAVLNSSTAQLIAKSYSVETSTSTHILQNVAVPKFDPSKHLHKELVELSRSAHPLSMALGVAPEPSEETDDGLFRQPARSDQEGALSPAAIERIRKELSAVKNSVNVNAATARLWDIDDSELKAIDVALAEL